jgi:polyphosphate kinase
MAKKIEIKFINREESWLYFNERVLQEAADRKVPLIERMKFLGIFSNNLDEFFRVRVATLSRMTKWKYSDSRLSGANPKKALKKVLDLDQKYAEIFGETYQEILSELATNNIYILNEKNLTPSQGQAVRSYFHDQVRPNLFPIMLNDSLMDFPLKDKSIYLGVVMKKNGKYLKDKFSIIKIPTNHLSRFFILPAEGKKSYIILLDDVIRYCLDDIFAIFNYDEIDAYTIKFTRDAELDIDSDISKSFLENISDSLKKRTTGEPVRFIYDKEIPEILLKNIIKKLKINDDDNKVPSGRYHNFKDFMSFPNLGSKNLEYNTLEPLPHCGLVEKKSIFDVIRKQDIMLHFPYQSFNYIIDLLREASIDPKVRSIRISLYRLANKSNVINALINAARNGKSVTVFMELQARFDEEANIYYAGRLQEEGVRIIQGIPGFKVHGKLLVIRRKEQAKNIYYGVISTGNFNESTAKVYADDCLLTVDPAITQEILKVFDLFDANFKQQRFKELVVSPFRMREHFISLLKNEIKNARIGKEAWAIIKLNNLVDEGIAKHLILAANEGVKLKLIIRGSCILQPDLLGLSENMEVISIVDRFLEHSRVIVFCNGGKELYYTTSADWMGRNFDNRIEVAVKIKDPEIQNELKNMLLIQLRDNVKARVLDRNNNNTYKTTTDTFPIRSQFEIYNYFCKKLSLANEHDNI